MQSWMMKLWLNNHDESEWPDLPIYQSEGACHVTGTEEHPSKEVIEKMCSESFFTHHKYWYVESIQRSVAGTGDEEQYEFCESPYISQSPQESSVLWQSPRELSTVSISPDRSSKFGQGEQTVEQEGASIENRDYYYSYPAVEEIFCEQRGCSMSQPEDAFSDTVDEEQYELCESPHISQSSQGSSVPYQSPREFLSTISLSAERSSKFGQGEQPVKQEGEFIESRDYYSYPAVEEMLSEERGFSMSQPEDKVSAYPQNKLVQTSYHGDEKEHDNRIVFPSFQHQDFCHPPKTEEIYSSDGANNISENDEGAVDVEDGPKHELCLENNTVYTELDKTNEGYMPLSKEQRNGEEPCFINSDTKELNTPLPQYSNNDSAAECYMCVDLLVQGPHQGQEDERSSSGPINSAEIFQNMEYKLKCDSNEDMAIQKLLKDAECLYRDIVQGRKKVSESRIEHCRE